MVLPGLKEVDEEVDPEYLTMESREKEALSKCRKDILLDLDVSDIMDFLLEKKVIDPKTKDVIFAKNEMEDQTSALLELLPGRGTKAFGYFLESLKDDYEWLADKLEEALEFSDQKIEAEDTVDSAETAKSRLKDLLMLGGVPSQPSHNVVRSEAVKELKQKVSELEPGQFLAIHGMPGSGKSVLAAEVVHDPDITLTYFTGGVFWFRVGMLEPESLLHRMKILAEKLDPTTSPTSIEHAQEILRRLFMSEKYSKSLLILDDVWSVDIIRAFSICARVLVTTRDISILDVISKHDQKIVEIHTGFTEKESLELFSKYVGLSTEYLPEEAKMIHQESKGSPMVISLIGSFISESGRHTQRHRQSGRWAYYLNNLKQRRYSKFKKQHSYQYESLMEAVLISIENLPDKLKSCYKELAVFHDDVGIPQSNRRMRAPTWGSRPHWVSSLTKSSQYQRSKGVKFGGMFAAGKNCQYYQKMNNKDMLLPLQVLMTYWHMNEYEVDDIMTEFCRKSLAASEYDMTLESYVYTIHDLQLEYLKSQLRDDEEKEKLLHRNFLDRYFSKVSHQFGNIVDDSYIFYNLGFHLFRSEQFELFSKIFLDLSFVEAMLKATSSVDLLNEYKRYGNFIISNSDDNLSKLEDFEAFARTIGALVNSSEYTDIIQLALREPEESAVYEAARRLAEMRPERLYFEWLNRDRVRGKHSATILHHGIVEAACFLPDMTKILTTNGEGQIKVWDVTSGEVLHRFTGHKSSVKTLCVSPEGDIFASGSEDGAVKIWDLGSFVDDSENGHEKQHAILRKGSVRGRSSETPRMKQTVGQLLTYEHELRDLSNQSFVFHELHNETVLCVAFSPDGEEVVAAGQSGLVKVFNVRGRALRLTLDGHKEAVNVCRFSWDGRRICTGSNDTTILLWDSENGSKLGSFDRHELAVLDLAFVPDSNKVLSMSSGKLLLWNAPTPNCRQCLDVIEFRRSRNSYFVCMRLSNSGRILAASTVDNIVTLWDVASVQVILALPGHSSHIYALDFTHDDMFLLSGSTDETVMIWSLESLSDESAIHESEPASLGLGPVFDVKYVQDVARMVAIDDTNCVQILDDGKLVFQSPPESTDITALALSENGQVVSYGCQNGSVRIFYPSSGTIKTLGMHNAKVTDVKIRTFIEDSEKEIEISPIVVSAAEDGSVKIWYEGGRTFDCNGHRFKAKEVHFVDCRDGRHLALSRSTNGSLRTWDVVSGATVCTWTLSSDDRLRNAVTCMDVSPIASLVAVGTALGRVILLELSTLKSENVIEPQKDLGPVRIVRFNKDGQLLVTGHDTGIIESRSSYGPTRRCHSGHKKEKEKQTTFCVLQIWETKTRTKLYQPIPLHKSWVTDVRWSHDDLHLVSVGDKIAWWTLQHIPKRKTSLGGVGGIPASRRKSLQFSRRARADSDRNSYPEGILGSEFLMPILQSQPLTPNSASSLTNLRVMKEGMDKSRELLQVFEIRGGTMSKIIPSNDFKKFVTLDDAGSAYFLQEIESPLLN